jgi:hypothetical protein
LPCAPPLAKTSGHLRRCNPVSAASPPTETASELATRHVREGQHRIADQERIVDTTAESGLASMLAMANQLSRSKKELQ